MIGIDPQPLTFAVVDDLAFAASRGRLKPPAGIYAAHDLGPVLELGRLSASGVLPPPTQADWLSLGDVAAFGDALKGGLTSWTCYYRKLGFLRLRAKPPADETEGIAFGLEAQKAAAAVGFPRKTAAQLVGAFFEIQSNVYEHSGASGTGLAVYRATARRFEFAVSDAGIGVLASLKSCSEYAGLQDHGEALTLTLTDGVSRHGKSARNRGMGFRPLFTGLANLNGELRFRSGDHALTMDGAHPSLLAAKQAEKPPMEGFLAAVACVLPIHGRQQ